MTSIYLAQPLRGNEAHCCELGGRALHKTPISSCHRQATSTTAAAGGREAAQVEGTLPSIFPPERRAPGTVQEFEPPGLRSAMLFRRPK